MTNATWHKLYLGAGSVPFVTQTIGDKLADNQGFRGAACHIGCRMSSDKGQEECVRLRVVWDMQRTVNT